MIFFSRFIHSLVPGISMGVGELETAAHLFQTDAATALVTLRFGMVAVGYFTTDTIVCLAETYSDVAGLCGRNAMLERIFDKGDKDERGNFGTVFRADVEVGFHCNVGRQADAHQGNVVADKVHFFVERRAGVSPWQVFRSSCGYR